MHICIPGFVCVREFMGVSLCTYICMWRTEITLGCCTSGSHPQDLSLASNFRLWQSGCIMSPGIHMSLPPQPLITSRHYHKDPKIVYVFLLIIYVKCQFGGWKDHYYDVFNWQRILVFPWLYLLTEAFYLKKIHYFIWNKLFLY